MKENHLRKHLSIPPKHTQHAYKHTKEQHKNISIYQAWYNMNIMNKKNKGDEELPPPQQGYGNMYQFEMSSSFLPSTFKTSL